MVFVLGGQCAGSGVTLLEAGHSGPNVVLAWHSAPGTTYLVLSRDTVAPGSWVTNAAVVAEDITTTWTDTAPLAATRLYRLLLPEGEQQIESPLATIPPCAPGDVPQVSSGGCCGLCTRRDHSGEFVVSAVDLRIQGRGLDFIWGRKYGSRLGPDTAQGNGWDFSCNIWARRVGEHVELHDGNLRRDHYLKRPNGTYTCEGIFREGSISNNAFTLMFADRGTWEFFPFDHPTWPGKIRNSTDRNGNQIQYQYDGLNRLVRVVDTLGRTNTVSYDGNGMISAVTDFSGRQVRYEYYSNLDPDGSLGDLKLCVSPVVTNTPNGNIFPGGKTNRYTYSKGLLPAALNGNLLTEINGLGQTVRSNRYHTTSNPTNQNYDRIEIEIVPLTLQSIHPVYVPITPDPTNNGASKKTIVNDRAGNVREYYYDNLNRPVMKREFTGRATPGVPVTENSNRPVSPLRLDDPPYFETQIDWNADSLPTMVSHPNGNLTFRLFAGDVNPSTPSRERANPVEFVWLPGVLGGDQTGITNTFEILSGFACELEMRPMGDGVIQPGFSEACDDGNLNNNDAALPRVVDISVGPPNQLFRFDDPFSTPPEQIIIYPTITLPDDGWIERPLPWPFLSKHTDGRGNETTYGHDANGNLLHRTNRISTVLDDWEYNAFGQCTAHILPANGSGQRRRDEYVYYPGGPQMGYLQNVVVDATVTALTTTYEYDLLGRLVRHVDPSGRDTLYSVNGLGQTVRTSSREVTTGSGIRYQTDYFYDANNNVVRVDVQNRDETGALGANADFTTTYEYDSLNRRIRSTHEVDAVKTVTNEFIYDANDHVTIARSGMAVSGVDTTNVVQFLYDERDLLFRKLRAPGGAGQTSTQYDYDANGNLRRTQAGIEGIPAVTEYVYDGFSRLVRQTNALGSVSTCHYDPNGNVVSVRFDGQTNDVAGGVGNIRLFESGFHYDKRNLLTNRVDSFFDVFTEVPLVGGFRMGVLERAPNGQVKRATDGNTNVTIYVYDTVNRLQSCTDPETNSVFYAYDLSGNVTQRVHIELFDTGYPPISETNVYAYDGLDRKIRQVDNAGITNQNAYDSRNNCVVETDGRNIQSRYEYDGLNRLVRTARDMNGNGANTAESADIVVIYSYDDASRRVTATDDNTNTTRYVYDSLDRLVRTDHADNTTNRYTYDVRDNVLQVTDAQGTVVTNGYDLLDRRTIRRMTTPGAGIGGPPLDSYVYDGCSRLVIASNAVSANMRRYDSLGNLITEIQQVVGAPPRTNSATFDRMGNRTQLVYPGGRTLVYAYDRLNRVKTVHDNPPGPATLIVSNNYFGPHRLARMDYGNGTRLDVAYDAARRVAAMIHTNVIAGGQIDARTYVYDNAHNKTLAQTPLGPHNYAYDPANRMVVSVAPLALPENYQFDGAGNRLQVTGPADPGFYLMNPTLPEPADFQVNQYSATPFDNRAYNRNGSLTNASIGPRNYAYDSRGQVGFINAPGLNVTCKYDSLGRRVEKIVNGQPTRYYYDGGRVMEEQNAANVTTATYAAGPAVDNDDSEVVFCGWLDYALENWTIHMRRGGNNFYYHTDHLGSVMKVTDQTSSVVEQYQYGDYGAPSFFNGAGTPIGGSAINNPFLFHGLRIEPESQLYFSIPSWQGPLPDVWFGSLYFDPRAGCSITGGAGDVNNNPASGPLFDPPIPTGFFGPGSEPFFGQVCYGGVPLGVTPFGSFEVADTIVQRFGDAFDRSGIGSGFEFTGPIILTVAPSSLNFQTDGPLICQALFQRLSPVMPPPVVEPITPPDPPPVTPPVNGGGRRRGPRTVRPVVIINRDNSPPVWGVSDGTIISEADYNRMTPEQKRQFKGTVVIGSQVAGKRG